MGKLDVHIKHDDGGEFKPSMFYAGLTIIFLVLLASVGGAVGAAITTLLIVAASVIGGGMVLGVLTWFLTRGWRRANAQAFADYRAEREEAHHRHRIETMQTKARINAQEQAMAAAMIAEAVRNAPPTWPSLGYKPPLKAEVIRDED